MSRNRRSRQKDDSQVSLGNFMLHWGAKLIFLTLIVVVVLSMVQCTVKKPEAPEWNTQLVVPLVNRTYDMPEIISRIDQDAISMDDDSNVVFSVEQALDTVQLDAANLTTASLSYNISQQLGQFTIAAPNVTPVTVPIGDMPSIPQIYPAVVPDLSFDIPATFPALSGMTSATIADGSLYLVATNNLGINLNTVSVTLFDEGRSLTVGTQTFAAGINDGETDSVLFVLDGQTISNSFSATAMCHTPGGAIPSADGREFAVEIHFVSDLTVDGAMAEIPAISRDFSDAVSLDESDVITSAVLSGGQVGLTINNNSALPATLEITIPDLKLNNVPLQVTRQVTSSGTTNVSIPLAGYVLSPADIVLPQELPINISATIAETAPNQVTVSSINSFGVQASISGLTFTAVTGNFSSTNMTIDPIVQDIDVPTGFDSIQLVNAVLTIELENSVGLPGQLDINLVGNNGKTLNINGLVNARVLATAATTTLTETDVANFLSPLPSQVSISGSASFGDGSSGTIRDGDYITGTVRIDAPVEMIIPETPIETDIESEEIEQDDIDQITDHVIEARLVYNITNHLPLGASISLVFSADSATLYTNPELVIDSISVSAAPVVSSVVVDTLSTGEQTILLDSADIQILKHAKLYIGQELILHGSNGQPVKLTKNDFISVIGRIEVEYRFDGEF
ncbi:MAG: hypothetical protein IPH75_03615 [bacterium]|nr:hypothetical protein [bacterium]